MERLTMPDRLEINRRGVTGLAGAAIVAVASTSKDARAQDRLTRKDHVALYVRFDFEQRRVRGLAELSLSLDAATDTLLLDAVDLDIASITDDRGAPMAFKLIPGEGDGNLQVSLGRKRKAGTTVRLKITYESRTANETDPGNIWGSLGQGLRFMGPSGSDSRRRVQAWSSNMPGSNRRWFPAIDRPDYLRTFELRATVPAALTAISNGRLIASRTNPDGTKTFHWRQDTAHQNHRSAVAIGEFVSVPIKVGDVQLENFGYPDELDGVAGSIVRLADMVAWFQRELESPLPAGGYNQVFVQDLPWGMAGAGLAILTENFVDSAEVHRDFLYLWDDLEAECIAEQWFGVSVAPREWRDIWLSRGIARYLSTAFNAHANGEVEVLLSPYHVAGDLQTVLTDWSQGVRLAVAPTKIDDVNTPGLGNAIYIRAGMVLRMLEGEIGQTALMAAIRRFARLYKTRLATSADFEAIVSQTAKRDLSGFFRQWIYGVGHPVFKASWHYDAGTGEVVLELNQSAPEPGQTLFAGTMDVEIDGAIEKVAVAPQANNVFRFARANAPRFVVFDHKGRWICALTHERPITEAAAVAADSIDPLARRAAMIQWGAAVLAQKDPTEERRALLRHCAAVAEGNAYWREKMIALAQMQRVLSANGASRAGIDAATTALLVRVIRGKDRDEAWVRFAALNWLGESRDESHADLYLSLLRDPSDRIINAAARALGKSKDPRAYEALLALEPHPSWKNQSRISMLDGLAELGDPRGGDVALRALQDIGGARWTLLTPVWDYRLAAAQALRRLNRSSDGFEFVLGQLNRALAARHVTDSFHAPHLMVALADPRGLEAMQRVGAVFQSDPRAKAAVEALRTQLEAALKPQGK
jgi:aminopeptidase N